MSFNQPPSFRGRPQYSARGDFRGRGRGRGRPWSSSMPYQRKRWDLSSTLSELAQNDSNDIILNIMSRNLSQLLRQSAPLEFNLLPDLFRVLNKVCLDDTSPELNNKFLLEVLNTTFFQDRLSTLLSRNFPALSNILGIRAQSFLSDLFFVMRELYSRFENAFENLRVLITVIEKFMETNKHRLPYITATVLEHYNNFRLINQDMVEKQLSRLSIKGDKSSKNVKLLKFENQKPPDDFRNLSVVPTAADFLLDSNEVFLRANRMNGCYETVNDYLDIQFRLMREDFLLPLREGIQEYLLSTVSRTRNKKLANVRPYHNVTIGLSLPKDNSGVVHEVHFQVDSRVNWEKRLIFGSLLCFSSDSFKTIYFGTVSEREIRTLRQGYIYVKFVNEVPSNEAIYVMLESMVYFEAYRHVLQRLQEIKCKSFPFCDYLVNCSSDASLPPYLNGNPLVYDLRVIANSNTALKVYPSRHNPNWPNRKYLDLDDSQMNALKTALTNELVLIQGPPGTGKTYIGLKIMKVLISSVQKQMVNFGPILIVCYTNHALDQFLEGIHKFLPKPGDIVRIGSRSKSEIIQNCSLFKLKQELKKNKSVPSDIHKPIREVSAQLSDLRDQILRTKMNLVRASKQIMEFDILSPYMSPQHKRYFTSLPSGNQKFKIRTWLLNDIDSNQSLQEGEVSFLNLRDTKLQQDSYLQEEEEEFVNAVDEGMWETRQRMVDDDQEEMSAEKMRALIHNAISETNEPIHCATEESGEDWKVVQQRRTKALINKKLSRGSVEKMSEHEARLAANLRTLSTNDRWRLYFYWISKLRVEIENLCHNEEEEFEALVQQRKELRFREDLHVMKSCKIIGMTTSGAARYGRVLSKLGCRIIVVEEAAEVLESHIIASLNENCEHLILIGDHKQLKPSPAVYKLAKDYALDVSLFERMIHNEVHYDTLRYQHRMRPEIAEVMKFIYPELENHPSVEEYCDIRGVAHNLFFIDHQNHESYGEDTKSYCNPFEVDYSVALCLHFLKNGYSPEKITILTLYSSQLFSIKKKMSSDNFKGVHLTSVDNFQGEENEIIILSLVRSNERDYIGFLAVENRVCVALSRARNGLYIIGNSSLLGSSKSVLWHSIIQHLLKKKQLGLALPLQCQNHKEDPPIFAYCAEDFDKAPNGGCHKPCKGILKCGHICQWLCHAFDQEHKTYLCDDKCQRPKPCLHPCSKFCYEKCSPCHTFVAKIIPNCLHTQDVPCGLPPEKFSCKFSVTKTLPFCLHKQKMLCSTYPESATCQKPCEKKLPCGHSCDSKCGLPCTDHCQKLVTRKLKFCGHNVRMPCGKGIDDVMCKEPCGQMMLCGHQCRLTCHECSNGRLHGLCKKKCNRKLVCGHLCESLCYNPCPPCSKQCDLKCTHKSDKKPCGEQWTPCEANCDKHCEHKTCSKKCCDRCEAEMCTERCSRRFKCGTCSNKFKCISACGEDCLTWCPSCNDKQLRNLFVEYSASVDNGNACLIKLKTCKHIFEMNYLDERMQTKREFLEQKVCPQCSTAIDLISCKRYGNLVIDYRNELRSIYDFFKEDLSSTVRNQKMTKLCATLSAHQTTLARMGQFFSVGILSYFMSADNSSKLFSLETSLTFYVGLTEVFDSFQDLNNLNSDAYFHACKSFENLLKWLNPSMRQFCANEVQQVVIEIKRLQLLIYFLRNPSIDKMETFIKRIVDGKDSPIFEKWWTQLGQLNIAQMSKLECALSFQKDHWKICPKNHVFAANSWRKMTRETICQQCEMTRYKPRLVRL